MQNLGILGGTFDPIHCGHLLMAETALSQAALNQVIWVPSRCPAYKVAVEFEHRAQMVQQAIADHPNFVFSPLETNCTRPDYAINTLLDLQILYPNSRWHWIIGTDAFKTLPRWHRRQELVPACEWLVAPRPEELPIPVDDNRENLLCQQIVQQLVAQELTIRWQLLKMPKVGISSSLIRHYCRQKHSIRYLVPEAVRVYISIHNLYGGEILN
ncbi:nicotinate (nicotinamide) nucleotide adenylyltransferase [Coleofasciculus sp. FACHB-64]|uniref:nicotinate (nicotinamide) nucleotide adenylyltransferase n=1 Tax=Cyanophyceae TaxID=3028117 RepID=UPI00168565D8|nr:MULTISPECIES: nicotinate (nicotinamide) nucleotide adenylyltransferase [unclassified Coleofasciculus]MBD1837699.1 nicotinate (nicotinamide) nucleotide adenylyltransferase [Coleofasciculus sp. FACHB-501]MBD1882202.1 nicotinate (nicotinamide) nucleotide adenylyltransferase [Coleofasciculus sp. FACHB-T130]MBD1890039.1 nicotinate (nicotinamide) nucleotide adenylyltransferase [Coleofasciculus sp. FACHB-SPT9]MBD2046959.1 nicotinate (nicotinamide) nucleotide adenylyltransferase [Coleofasciculus sp.